MRTKGKEPLFHIAKRDALPWHKSFGIRLAAIAAALVVCGILTTVLTGINPIQVYVSILWELSEQPEKPGSLFRMWPFFC